MREVYAGQTGITDAGWSVSGPGGGGAARGPGLRSNNGNDGSGIMNNSNENSGMGNTNGVDGHLRGSISGSPGSRYVGENAGGPSQAGKYDDARIKKLLNVFIHDFLIKSELKETAQLFEREASLIGKDKMISASHDVPEGFLYEWWQIFWDVFNARTHRGGSEVARTYFEMQLQRQRQEHTYRGVTMHVARFQQTAEQKGYYQHEILDPMELASVASYGAQSQFNPGGPVPSTVGPSAPAGQAAGSGTNAGTGVPAGSAMPSSATSSTFPGYSSEYPAMQGIMSNNHPSLQTQQQQQQFQAFYNSVHGIPNSGYYASPVNPYVNQPPQQPLGYNMGTNNMTNPVHLKNNNGRPAGTGTGAGNGSGNGPNTFNSNSTDSNNVSTNKANAHLGNSKNGRGANNNSSESLGNNDHLAGNSAPAYATNMAAPNHIPNSMQGQHPSFTKNASFSQQLGSIPTYINMNIPNSAPVIPTQKNGQVPVNSNNQNPLIQQGVHPNAPNYSNQIPNTSGVNNISMNNMNNIRGSNMMGINQGANPSFEMSSMDGLYNYQKELLMLEKENKKVLSIAKDGPHSSGSTPHSFTLSNSTNINGKKNSNAMLPPNSSQIASPQNQSPLNGGGASNAGTNNTIPKKRKYTKRSTESKKSQSEPNTPNISALTPGSANGRNANMTSSLNTTSEHYSNNNSPRIKIQKNSSTTDSHSPLTLTTEASVEQNKGSTSSKRSQKSSNTSKQGSTSSNPGSVLASASILSSNKSKKATSKKTPINAATPQNAEDHGSGTTSSKDPGSNNSIGLLPHNVLTDPTPHTDFDPMSIDPALSASSAFEFGDDDDSMLGILDNGAFGKKGDSFPNSHNQKQVKDEKNNEKTKGEQSGFNLDFLDPSNGYNDFNFLNWQ
ncbi:Transcriptional activator flo8 [Kluyveromyces marxianus]|nr:Transcriptional activator flo8 [Kluyveromyces marxianus]